jgi:uncharacterized protein (TIGR02231 family)
MSTKAAEINKQSFVMKDQKSDKVVVFTDRAEVRRVVKATLKKGENELLLTGVSTQIDRDSVRVEGHGEATVVDVVCQSRHVVESNKSDADSAPRVTELKTEIRDLEAQVERVTKKQERTDKQANVLNDFATTLSKPSGGSAQLPLDLSKLNSGENVTNFMSFIEAYASKSEQLDLEKMSLEKEFRELNEKLSVARENLSKLVGYETYNEVVEVVILLESAKDANEVELFVSYVVYGASWVPKYDIRVHSKDKSMIINYFGMITQSTGTGYQIIS